MPYINGVYMASRAPQSPRRFAPRTPISRLGRYLQHHDIPSPRPDILPRALSEGPMNNELERYMHDREARDHGETAKELERIAGTPEFFRNERHGDYVQRRGGVIQEDDRLHREHYLFLRNMESRITAYFRGNSDLSPRDLLRELRNDIRIELPDLLGSPGEPDAVFPGALPPGPYTIEDRRPIDRTVPFNEVPFFEPGNQCHSPKSDEEDGIHLGVKGLRRHAGVRKWHNHKDKGELADGPRAAKLARVGRGYDVAVHGPFNWQPAGTRGNPLVLDTTPSPPPFSPLTPLISPITPPPPPPPAPAPAPPAPPAPRGRKRKAPAGAPPTRTNLPRKAKAVVKYT